MRSPESRRYGPCESSGHNYVETSITNALHIISNANLSDPVCLYCTRCADTKVIRFLPADSPNVKARTEEAYSAH